MTTRHALLLSIVRMLLSSSANATIKSFAGLATLQNYQHVNVNNVDSGSL